MPHPFLRLAAIALPLALASCGARSGLREPADGSVLPAEDVPATDVPALPDVPAIDVRLDVPGDIPTVRDIGADVTPMVSVTCPAPVRGRQTDTVPLTASASSNVGLPLRYTWQVTRRPAGSTTVPVPADAPSTRFTFDTGGDWILDFTATDSAGNHASCTTHLTAQPAINLLCPDDQSNYQGATVSLNATASSNLGRGITLRWAVLSRPAASATSPVPGDSLNARLLLDALGDWRAQLTATDSGGLTATCVTNVHADPDVIVMCPADSNSAPFATINLAATASSRLGMPLRYHWEIVDQPITSTAAIPSPGTLATPFTFDVAGNWTWRFTATNTRGNSASCTTRALATSDEALRVEVVWNTDRSCVGCNAQGGGQDLDLHLTDDSRNMGHWASNAPSDSDCYYANCRCGSPGMLCTMENLDWPPPGPPNNPQLDVDHIDDLPGPENINIVRAVTGSEFDVGVHFYSSHGLTNVTPVVVRVYCSGSVAFESEVVRLAERSGSPDTNNLWRVGRVTMTPGGCSFARCGRPGALTECIRPESSW